MAAPTIAELIAAHAEGHALARAFYVREDIFARDMEILLSAWTCVGHVDDVRAAGDFLAAELGSESAIIVRGEDGSLRALANVCRHRGSRLVPPGRGHAGMFACPYHAWTYRLDGTLRAAREMGDGFEPALHGLKPLPIAVVGGVIFVAFAPDPPALDQGRRALETLTGLFGWQSARIAARKTYAIAANWKLALENYHECYHCAPAHPEFSALHTLARPKARRAKDERDWLARLARAGLAFEEVQAWPIRPDGQELARLIPSTLGPAVATGSKSGELMAPLMGKGEALAGGCAFAEVGRLSAFLAYPDHGVIYRFLPKAPRQTEMEVLWLVAEGAVEGRDYDTAELTWLWDVTSLADKKIVEMNQAGVASLAYEPGPFSPMEDGARIYVERYLSDLARAADDVRP
ncbi:MAG TPA: aromatic ring-hydroxylating dioxygenase subunit alpha [Caulobacteraceae bacterium]|nr:aromatic ring-hydroxylating dioxygenase subunit alpha [Caulobacteraceae bacterium]